MDNNNYQNNYSSLGSFPNKPIPRPFGNDFINDNNFQNPRSSLPPLPKPPSLSYEQQELNILSQSHNNLPPLPPNNNFQEQNYQSLPTIPNYSIPPVPPPNNYSINEQQPILLDSYNNNNILPPLPPKQDFIMPEPKQYESIIDSQNIQINNYQSKELPPLPIEKQYNSNTLPPIPYQNQIKPTPSPSIQNNNPIQLHKQDNIAVIRLNKEKKNEKPSYDYLLHNKDEDQLVDDPRLIKVQDHREIIPEIYCNTIPDNKIHFINLPKPIVSPLDFVLPFNSGINAPVYPNDYNQIIKNCYSHRKPFIDESFPSSPEHNKCGEYTVTWRRIKEMDPFAIFSSPSGPISSDIIQGGCCNTPFISVVSALVNNQKLFKKVVPVQEWNRNTMEDNINKETTINENFCANVFRFNFWKWGKWIEIIVDDKLPYLGDSLAFGTCRKTNEYWFPLLEKAYAKLYGSYQAIEYCTIDEIILDLTGGSCEIIDLQYNNSYNNLNEFLNFLKKLYKKKYMLFFNIYCDEKQSSNRLLVQPNGLLLGRPYYITSFSTVKLNGKKSKHGEYNLIRLLSPWDKVSYSGPWSTKSVEMINFSPKEIQKYGLTNGKLEFWMNISDLYKEFSHLYICKVLDLLKQKPFKIYNEWNKQTAGGCLKNISWSRNPQYILTISQKIEIVHISLLQKDWKFLIRDSNKLQEHIGFCIFKVEDNRTVKIHRIVNIIYISDFENRQEIASHIILSKGRYIIIPSTYKSKKKISFYLRIWTEKYNCSCKEIKRAAPKKGLFQSRPTGVLTIEAVKAKGLRKVGVISCDPYVEITVEGNTKRTRIAKDTINPEWRQQFIYFLKKPNKATIKITIWHEGLITSTFLGTAKINISDLIQQVNGATYRTAITLKARKKDEKQGREITGFIILRLNYFGDIKQC